jgi:uncharacterized membrane protein
MAEKNENEIGTIEVKLENKEVVIFNNYPILVNSNDIKYIEYQVQKKQSDKNFDSSHHGLLDRAKVKPLEAKDSMMDTTK